MISKFIKKLLYKWSANLPIHVITLGDTPYMERYYIGKWFGWTFRLHRFVSSDVERHLHNHPWSHGGSIILTGSYTEEVAVDICPHASDSGCVTKHVHRRFFNIVNGNTFHRIGWAERDTWTLFFHNERAILPNGESKGWGFLEQVETIDEPYTRYTRYLGKIGNWWETAPLGRDAAANNIRRRPL